MRSMPESNHRASFVSSGIALKPCDVRENPEVISRRKGVALWGDLLTRFAIRWTPSWPFASAPTMVVLRKERAPRRPSRCRRICNETPEAMRA